MSHLLLYRCGDIIREEGKKDVCLSWFRSYPDSYFTFAQDFVAGTISLGKLSEAMRLGRLGEQIVLKSRTAFERIRFVSAERAAADSYYEKKILRDRDARREYRSIRQSSDGINELYMIDIMREGIENGDPRLC